MPGLALGIQFSLPQGAATQTTSFLVKRCLEERGFTPHLLSEYLPLSSAIMRSDAILMKGPVRLYFFFFFKTSASFLLADRD